ncbi:hypothetical protein HZS_1025 [Henneguya salminicola]|nr:hypothetical protein HZS_1025 [Henneguya salminicola]
MERDLALLPEKRFFHFLCILIYIFDLNQDSSYLSYSPSWAEENFNITHVLQPNYAFKSINVDDILNTFFLSLSGIDAKKFEPNQNIIMTEGIPQLHDSIQNKKNKINLQNVIIIRAERSSSKNPTPFNYDLNHLDDEKPLLIGITNFISCHFNV